MLEACVTPELVSEITLQPVRRHGVDAAIFFSDIVVPLMLVGVEVSIVAGRGPVFAKPVNTPQAVDELVAIPPAVLLDRAEPIREAVQRTTAMLALESERRGEPLPLIGFAGAPFTLAAYLVEGGPSKDHLATRAFMRSNPDAWDRLLAWLAELTGSFLAVQVAAGASAAQLFDSWAGVLAPEQYRALVLPHSRAALAPVRALDVSRELRVPHIPTVHFGVGTGELLHDIAALGTDAIGVDHRVSLAEAVQRIGRPVTVQGNLDPAELFAPADVRDASVRRILRDGLAARAHVFNLGHGVPASADPDVLTDIVRLVHDWEPGAGRANQH